ncbi:MAG: hypothetical protein ABFE13_01625 [Phycisphaerales bacterium]
MADESALSIAGKRRHLLLLEKIRENKPLTRAEVAELRQYEEAMSKRPGKTDEAQAQAPAPAPVRLTPAAVREAALECETMAQAEGRLGVEDLAAELEKSKRLGAAWEKGRRLRAIRELAVTPICMEEASKRLGLGEDGLAKLYKRDPEARDLWDRGRVSMLVEVKAGILKGAAAGRQSALDTVERVLKGEFGMGGRPAAVDFARLTPTQMEAATGVNHRQILRWHRKHGLARNADRTYSMPAFIAWLKQFEVDKIARTAGTAGVDSLREQKARIAKVDAELAEGRVVPKEHYIRTLMTQTAWLVQLLSEAKAEEWAALHEGRTALQLKEMYLSAFAALREQWCVFPAEVQVPPAARAKFEEAFQLMKGDGYRGPTPRNSTRQDAT